MTRQKAIAAIIIIAAALALLAALTMAGDAAEVEYSPFAVDHLLAVGGEFLLFILFTFGALFAIAIIFFLMFSGIVDFSSRKTTFALQKLLARDIPLLLLAVLTLAGMVNLALYLTGGEVPQPLTDRVGGEMGDPPFEEFEEADPPAWLFPYMGTLSALVAASFVVAVALKVREVILLRGAKGRFEADDEEDMDVTNLPFPAAGESEEAWPDISEICRLLAKETPRPAVLQAYQVMISSFSRAGLYFPEKSTPEEKLDLVEKEIKLPPDNPVRQLTDLYLKARYSEHRISENDRENAIRWLEEATALVEGPEEKEAGEVPRK